MDMLKFKNEKALYAATGAVIMLAAGLLGWFLYKNPETAQHNPYIAEEPTKPECARRYFDGVCDEDGIYEKRMVAIMIENHSGARPQSGLADAAIVYEAPVEGNFTRFMAFFPLDADVKKIGPVRSARPYYLDWAEEFGKPMYMHSGGSPDALDEIEKREMFDMNEFYRGWYFWRDEARYAPHNLYTSSELFRSAWDKYGEVGLFATSSWKFDEGAACTNDCVKEIDVVFSHPNYNVTWKYSTSTNMFERYQAGKKHVDADGRAIVADTVIVQHANSLVLDSIGRLMIDTRRAGEATVFTNGKAIEARWGWDDDTQKTRWYVGRDFNEEVGAEVALKPGKIWIEVAKPDTGVKFVMNETGEATLSADQFEKTQTPAETKPVVSNFAGSWIYSGSSIWSGNEDMTLNIKTNGNTVSGSFIATLSRGEISALFVDAGTFSGTIQKNNPNLVNGTWEGDRGDSGTFTLTYNPNGTITLKTTISADDRIYTIPTYAIFRKR